MTKSPTETGAMPPQETYVTEHLGDGAYATFEGWGIWLGANHSLARHVYLDGQPALQALVDYARRCGMRIK